MNHVGEFVGVLFVVLVPIAIALVIYTWTISRSDTILRNWASQHRYRIVQQQYCWFWRGPFFWTSSKNQVVYHVTVEDRDGRQRTGYVRCGGWFWGLLVDTAEVRWD